MPFLPTFEVLKMSSLILGLNGNTVLFLYLFSKIVFWENKNSFEFCCPVPSHGLTVLSTRVHVWCVAHGVNQT